MIQDIAPHTLHNEYFFKEPDADGFIIVFSENNIMLKADRNLSVPRKKDLEPFRAVETAENPVYQYLFCIDQDDYFLYMDFENVENIIKINEKKCRFEKISLLRESADKELCFAVYTAYHLYQWYVDNQFCGRCGRKVHPDRKERMLCCDRCGNQIYPKIAPAVIVAVTNGDRILLTKYADREYKRYALIAGFTEIGETAEETVRREVMEEVGLRVKNICYYKTQPWGIAGNLLIGYFAELDGDDAIYLDRSELALAEWVHRRDLTNADDGISLTREMMRVFLEKKEPFVS